jgi:hypothetical protein
LATGSWSVKKGDGRSSARQAIWPSVRRPLTMTCPGNVLTNPEALRHVPVTCIYQPAVQIRALPFSFTMAITRRLVVVLVVVGAVSRRTFPCRASSDTKWAVTRTAWDNSGNSPARGLPLPLCKWSSPMVKLRWGMSATGGICCNTGIRTPSKLSTTASTGHWV